MVMAFRFDMQGKTPQQQIIVSKRDNENKRRKQEAEKNISPNIDSHTLSAANDKDTHISLLTDFREFLYSIKCLTDKGIDCRLSRLRWVEDACKQSAACLTSDIQTMYRSRSLIYQKADSPHKAGNYYNALMLYYEFVHGEKCPRINNKLLE
jgi:hypothetical protein